MTTGVQDSEVGKLTGAAWLIGIGGEAHASLERFLGYLEGYTVRIHANAEAVDVELFPTGVNEQRETVVRGWPLDEDGKRIPTAALREWTLMEFDSLYVF